MRLFTAVDIPEEVVAKLDSLIDHLRPAARIKWSPAANLHITTKFIGNWPDERLPEIEKALKGIPTAGPIPIEVRGVGFFPNPHSPRVFWAAVHAPAALSELARATDDALQPLGIEPEKRAFSPHLTLARIKEPVPLAPLRQAIAQLEDTDFGAFTADRFYLYQSTLRPSGSIYTRLSDYSL